MQQQVKIGRRYKKVSLPWITWEVIGTPLDWDGIRHVRLVNISDPTRVILIAESIVARPEFFALVPA